MPKLVQPGRAAARNRAVPAAICTSFTRTCSGTVSWSVRPALAIAMSSPAGMVSNQSSRTTRLAAGHQPAADGSAGVPAGSARHDTGDRSVMLLDEQAVKGWEHGAAHNRYPVIRTMTCLLELDRGRCER